MIIYGSITGFKKEEIDNNGFPLDGIQLCMNVDLITDELDVTCGTDVFLDIFSAEYCVDGNVLNFKCKCESMMLDGNETDLEINGDLAYSIVRNSKVTEIILSGDYSDFSDKKEKGKLKKMKVLGSLLFNIGNGSIYKKANKVKFY